MHPDQLDVPLETVRVLVNEQFPEWTGLSVQKVESTGTVNAIFRIGDGLAARFPLQPADVDKTRQWLRAEAAAAQRLLGRTRFASPEPVALGEPGAGYPLPWSVQTWLPGVTAADEDPGESTDFGHDLAEFIRGVRALDTGGRTFRGGGRGGVIAGQEDWVRTCFERSEGLLDVPRLRSLWRRYRDLPRGNDPDVMTHGDLIPGNVLVADGRLVGVLDVGGLKPTDPALELVAGWHLLEDGPRRVLREALDIGEEAWERGKAWAFVQALGAVWYYVDTNPAMHTMGHRTLGRIVRAESG